MTIQQHAPYTIQVTRDGQTLNTVELNPRQSWRLTQFAAANGKTLAEMISVAVSSLTEDNGPTFTVPDDVEKAEAEERELRFKLRQGHANN